MLTAVKVGDVLRAPSGRLRVVRYARMAATPRKSWVAFAINHCSWTHRPYTFYNLGELNQIGYTATDKRVKLRSKLDKALALELSEGPRCLDCCDVVGIS